MTVCEVPGATGLLDTNYEGKVAAALEFLRQGDFVFLHVEAPDECGHDRADALGPFAQAVQAGLEAFGELSHPVDGAGHFFGCGQAFVGAFPGGAGAVRGSGGVLGHFPYGGVHFLHGNVLILARFLEKFCVT